MTPQTSPIVAFTLSAARIGWSRLPVPWAVSRSSARRFCSSSWSRFCFRVGARAPAAVGGRGAFFFPAANVVRAVLVAWVVAPGRPLALRADVGDALDGPAELLDLVDQLLRARLDLVGERLYVVRA